MNTTVIERRPRVVTVCPAAPQDEWAVRLLFAALHAFNAELEPRFALGEGWAWELAVRLAEDRRTGRGVALLAWDGDEPVGLAMLAASDDPPLFRPQRWAELAALYVVPGARDRGVADALLATGLAWARERGYERMRLWMTASNVPARRFYERSGFRPVQEVLAMELGSALAAATPDDADREAA